MNITLENYIKNPSGGRARMVGEAEAVRNVYTEKFNKLMLRVAGKIDYVMFKEGNDRYLILIKIPSESVKNVTYDVVFDFFVNDDGKARSNHLNDYYVRFFSNDPNFNFTYANVFRKNNLLVPELRSLFDPIVFKESPKTTNPNRTVGYVKSLYFAYLYFKLRGLDNKINWTNAAPLKFNVIRSMITPCGKKILQVQNLQKLEKATEKGSLHIGEKDYDDVKKLSKLSTAQSNISKSVRKSKMVSRENMRRNHMVKTTRKIR